MLRNPFDGARARVARAERHIRTIAEQQAELFTTGLEWRTEQTAEGYWVNKIVLTKDMPDEVEGAAWDSLQNLRASLDLAVNAAALRAGATCLKNTYFHFASSEAEWEKSYRGRTKAAPAETIATMRQFAPWPEGNKLLYALSRASAGERHQIAAPVVVQNSSVHMGSFSYSGRGPILIGSQQWDPVRRELVVTLTGDRAPIPDDYRVTSFIAFGAVEFVEGQPIVPVLHALCGLCKDIIQSVEEAPPSSTDVEG